MFTDSQDTTRVRYYFTDNDFLPIVHRFGTDIWLTEGEDNGFEQIPGAVHKWVNGQKVGSAPGDHYCGTPAQWLNGQPLPPGTPVPLAVDGTPLCCFGVPISSIMFGEGGQSQGFDRASVQSNGGQRQGGRGVWLSFGSGGQRQGGQGSFAEVASGGQQQGGSGLWVETASDGQQQGGVALWPVVSTGGQVQGGSGLAVAVAAGGQRQGGEGGDTEVIETASLFPFAGATVPAGYLGCDGSAVSRTTYANLFAAVGTTWGAGNGTTTFNVPDFRGRVLLGAGTGAGLTARVLGTTGGEENHALVTAELAAHTHGENVSTIGGATMGVQPMINSNAGGASNVSTASTGAGTAHNTMQPWACVNYIIKT